MGKLNKQQLMNKIQGLLDDVNNYNGNIDATPEVFTKGYEANVKLNSFKEVVAHELLKKFNNFNDLKNFVSSDGVKTDDYAEKLIKAIQNKAIKGKAFNDDLRNITEERVSYLERMEQVEQYIEENPQFKEEYLNTLSQSIELAYRNKIVFSSFDKIEKYVELLDKEKPISDYDFSNCFIDLLERSNNLQERRYEKELDGIISNNNLDPETLKKVNDAKEICTYGTNESCNLFNQFAEGLGDKTNRAQLLQDVAFIKKNYTYGDKVSISRQAFNVNGASESEQVTFAKEAIEKRGYPDKETQKDILDAVKFIQENDPNGKFEILNTTRDELGKAIEKGDINEITKQVDKYNELDKKFSDVVNSLNSHGSHDRFAINMSMGRQRTIPGKYRNDIRGATLYRLGNVMGSLANKYDVNLEEYLSDPVKGTQQLYSKISKNNTITKFVKEHPIEETLAFLTNKAYLQEYQQVVADQEDLVNVGNSITMVGNMMDPKENSSLSAAGTLINEIVGRDVAIENSSYSSVDTSIKFARIMTVEKEDMNLYALDTQRRINPDTLDYYPEFSIKDYVENGKTTPENILSRIERVGNSPLKNEDWYKESSKLVANELLSIPNKEYNPQTKYILDTIKSKGIDKVSKTDFDIMHSIELTSKDEKQKDAVESLYKLNKEYDSRSIFWKIFGRDTRRLRNNIKAIKETLSNKMGADRLKHDLEELKNNELNPNRSENNIVEPKIDKTNEMVNEDRERFSVTEAVLDKKDTQLSEFKNAKEITAEKNIDIGSE